VHIRFLAIAALVTILGAACTGSDEPAPTPPVSTSTASASPTPTGPLTTGPGVRPGEKPPALPEIAKQHTPAGALLFAEYFIRALDWSAATNDAYLLVEVSAPSCEACQRDISAAMTLRAEGAIEQGGRIKILGAQLVTGTFNIQSDYVVEVTTMNEAVVIVKPSSAPSTAALPVAKDRSLVFVSWTADGWKIAGEGKPS
jgi:hypothetical protein